MLVMLVNYLQLEANILAKKVNFLKLKGLVSEVDFKLQQIL